MNRRITRKIRTDCDICGYAFKSKKRGKKRIICYKGSCFSERQRRIRNSKAKVKEIDDLGLLDAVALYRSIKRNF